MDYVWNEFWGGSDESLRTLKVTENTDPNADPARDGCERFAHWNRAG